MENFGGAGRRGEDGLERGLGEDGFVGVSRGAEGGAFKRLRAWARKRSARACRGICGCRDLGDVDDGGSRSIQVNDLEATHASKAHASNLVTTAKYTWYSFLPKFTLEALSKFANTYFLVVCFLQGIRSISITNGVPYNALPLFTVLFVEAVALILEDRQRYRDDRVANTSETLRLEPNGGFNKCAWADLRAGDIVCLKNREAIPADVMILASSNEDGQCFVETKSLDGETNLKLRHAISAGAIGMSGLELLALRGSVDFQNPDAQIDAFDGYVSVQTVDGVSVERTVTVDHLLLRGCVLRNTNVVCGMVLNCGHDTKIMMSSSGTRAKLSSLDIKVNRYLRRFLVFEILLCVLCTVLSREWFVVSGKHAYYLHLGGFATSKFVQRVFTFFLLIANMIPIALYVAMKFARFFQAQFMMMDQTMWLVKDDDPAMVVPMRVKTMDLNDALGQVDHLFTDKTGTLTTNLMEFRKCSIAGSAYGLGSTTIGLKSLERSGRLDEAATVRRQMETLQPLRADFFHFVDDPERSLVTAMRRENEFGEGVLYEFFTALALCHQVLLERVHDEYGRSTGEIRLSAASPEDQALVSAASEFGVEFRGRNQSGESELMVLSYRGEATSRVRTFEVLDILEFTSARRRMSVVVRDAETRRIFLICKGGDDVMFERLRAPCDHRAATETDLNGFAEEGLRTLVVAQRELELEEFERWQFRLATVKSDVHELGKRKRKEPNAIDALMDELETDLRLLGAVAIEDRLQDGVPETLQQLGEAGMRIWMLTGDKLETALNIGYACNLFPDDIDVVSFSSGMAHEVGQELRALAAGSGTEDLALVLEGRAIEAALRDAPEALRDLALRRCRAVVACRSSPLQKAALVKFVKQSKRAAGLDGQTLAIGDGANDVPMIQAAHIGVGIQAADGMQAANSADYSIGQFRFLARLVLVHGRANYRRMSKLILFTFYKNIMLTSAQFLFSLVNGWSGQKFYLELGLQSFNLIFTMAPSFLLAVLDQDLPDGLVLSFPALYRELGVRNALFTSRVFWQWLCNGVWHAAIIFTAVMCLWRAREHDLWEAGCMILSLVILVANCKIFFELSKWRFVDHAAWWITAFLWPLAASLLELPFWLFVGAEWGFVWLGVFSSVIHNHSSWYTVLFVLVTCLLRDFAAKGWRRAFHPRLYHILQECLAYGRPLPRKEDLFGPKVDAQRQARGNAASGRRFEQLQRMSSSQRLEDHDLQPRRAPHVHIELT